jgi:hypothetical protein
MDDLHSINDAINRRAGRKLGPSILVSLSLVAIVWASLAFEPIFFAALVTLAVCLGIREISRAFAQAKIDISASALTFVAIGLSVATWFDGVEGFSGRHCGCITSSVNQFIEAMDLKVSCAKQLRRTGPNLFTFSSRVPNSARAR